MVMALALALSSPLDHNLPQDLNMVLKLQPRQHQPVLRLKHLNLALKPIQDLNLALLINHLDPNHLLDLNLVLPALRDLAHKLRLDRNLNLALPIVMALNLHLGPKLVLPVLLAQQHRHL